MKTILAFFAVALLTGLASATTDYVDINGLAPYTQVQPAIDAAVAGDTILVAPGHGGYQGFTVDRRLTIIGAGTGTHANEASRIDGIVIITGTADSTELQGLWIIGSGTPSTDSSAAILRISNGAVGVFIWRCFLENTTNTDENMSCVYLGSQSSTQFTQDVFKAPSIYGRGFGINTATSSGWTLTLVSCVFGTSNPAISATLGVIQADHCVLTTNNNGYILNVSGCGGLFSNSAFLHSGGPSWAHLGSVVLNYCAANGAAPPGWNNIVCSTADFVNLASYNNPRLCDYHLSENSVLRDAGNPVEFDLDSSRADIGIYGGMHPYVESGAPDYPFVLDVDVPTSVPQNGAVRVYARGRIGPGY